MTEHMQARTSDLPGWPCPPRVRDIPSTPESWGWVPVQALSGAVAQDEVGCLWLHPKSFGFLRSISRLDEPDRWVPVMVVLPEPPS